jgi:hypothetical protein
MTQTEKKTLKLMKSLRDDIYTKIRARIQEIEPHEGKQVLAATIPYGDHHVNFLYDELFPEHYLEHMTAVFESAEAQGYLPQRNLILQLMQTRSQDSMGGVSTFRPLGEMLEGTIVLNLITQDQDTRVSRPRGERQLLKTLEHETWHAIDMAGEHSAKLNETNGTYNFDDHSVSTESRRVIEDLMARYQHNALSVRELHQEAVKTCREEEKRYYSNHTEAFVHLRMSARAGLTPDTVEALDHSHNFGTNLASFLYTLHRLGVKSNLVRSAMKRFIASFEQPAELLEQLEVLGSRDLWQDL